MARVGEADARARRRSTIIIGFGSDPNATDLKLALMAHARELGHEVRDFGADDQIYPHTAIKVAEEVVAGRVDRGVVLCGTGIGVSIAANKVPGAYCALLGDVLSGAARPVEQQRQHDRDGRTGRGHRGGEVPPR